jgi:hypothetical protein
MTSPIIDQISGDIEQSQFDISIKPAGGDATKDLAELRDGLVRNIENISNAQDIYADAGRGTVTAGIDGWMVTTDFYDDNSFDQDLMIKPIPNFIDRVWFDVGSLKRDRSDSRYGFLLSAIPRADFKERWPNASGSSVSNDNESTAYWDKPDTIIIGHVFYRKERPRTLIKTNFGRIFEEENFEEIKEKLAASGEVEEDRRIAKDHIFYVRKFDNNDWLDEEEETVFSQIPLIPVYGNFKVVENKITYHGAVRKLVDPQRIYNYSISREIEEGALAPRSKYWMTAKQVGPHSASLQTLNTNKDPVQLYENDPNVPGPPQQQGGAQINPGLRVVSDNMQQAIQRSSGIFAAGMGGESSAQSGVAIDKLQDKSNNITVKYFKALEVAICQTARVIQDALPRVYDAQRQLRILKEDGSFEMIAVNVAVNQGGELVIENDLSAGKYDVTCTSGPSFNNRQQQMVRGLLEIAAIDPSVLQLGQDVFLNNVNTPGVDKIAERSRALLMQQGLIPFNQMTQDEQAQVVKAQSQPPQPTAEQLLAQAEQAKADAMRESNMVKMQQQQGQLLLKEQDIRLQAQKLQLQAREQELKIAEKMADMSLRQDKQAFEQTIELMRQAREDINADVDNLNKQADTLKTLREAMGVDTIVGPSNTEAYINQASIVQREQLN